MSIEIAKLLHDIGIILGVGGVTFQYLIKLKTRKDKDLNVFAMSLDRLFGVCIPIGLIFLVISGIWLNSIISWPIDRNMLFIKAFLIGVLVVNAIWMNFHIKRSKEESKKLLFFSETFGFILWWAITIVSVFL